MSGFVKLLLNGLALLLVARGVCAVARWAWDLSRSVVATVLASLEAPATLVTDALKPQPEPAAAA